MFSAGSLGVIYFQPDLVAYLSLTTSSCGSTHLNELVARLFLSSSIYLPTIYEILIVLTRDTVLTTHVYRRKFARIYPVPNSLDVYL